MTTPETRDEGIALTAPAQAPIGPETLVPPFLTGLVIIGLAAAFLVAIIGFATDRFVVLVSGSFALSMVTLLWSVVAAAGLWKSVRSWLLSRRAAGNEVTGTGPSR